MKEVVLTRPEPLRVIPGKASDRCGERARKRSIAAFLLLLLGVSLLLAGCGGYTTQARKCLTQGRSQILGSAYTLEQFGDGGVSGPFLQASLQQNAKAMKSTAQRISSLKAPPGAREEHQRQVAAISRAQKLVQGVGQRGVDPGSAPELAQKLREIAQELRL